MERQRHPICVSVISSSSPSIEAQLTLSACRGSCDCVCGTSRFGFEVYPRGHGSRVGLGFLGNDEAFPLRGLLGVLGVMSIFPPLRYGKKNASGSRGMRAVVVCPTASRSCFIWAIALVMASASRRRAGFKYPALISLAHFTLEATRKGD